MENFPFESFFHQEIKYDPNVYDARGSAHWPEERKDKAYWKMKQRVQNHGFLRNFYDSWLPYSEEFEQMCNIVKEEFGEVDNTITLGWTFNTLKKYYQAAQRDPDKIYRENVQVELPAPEPPEFPNEAAILGNDFHNLHEEGQQKRLSTLQLAFKEYMEYAPEMASYEVRDVTWGKKAERLKECILGALISNDVNPDQPWMSEEQARTIQERLVNEIPAAGFLEMGEKSLCYVTNYESELKPGDPMLVK